MNIAEKIAKLIAKAESTDNTAEAATFMEKAHQLMEAHGVSLLDVGRLDEEDPVGTTRMSKPLKPWAVKVAMSLARYYGCRPIQFEDAKQNKMVAFSGRQSARVTAELMVPFVMGQVRKLANEGVKAGDYKSAAVGQRSIGNALYLRINKMHEENKAQEQLQTQAEQARSTALVPVDIIKAEFEEQFPHSVTIKTSFSSTASGREAAGKVNLNTQLGQQKAGVKLIS